MTDHKTYIEHAISLLDELNAEIKRDEDREPEKLSAAVEIERREGKKLLRQKQVAVEEYIKQLQHATEETWDSAKAGFERSLEELQHVLTKNQKTR